MVGEANPGRPMLELVNQVALHQINVVPGGLLGERTRQAIARRGQCLLIDKTVQIPMPCLQTSVTTGKIHPLTAFWSGVGAGHLPYFSRNTAP